MSVRGALAALRMPGGRLKVTGVLCAVATGVALLVGLGAPAQAQSITAVDVSGSVRDSAGLPIDEAIVSLIDDATGSVRIVASSGDGTFAFGVVPAGSYQVNAEQLGYRPVRVTGVWAGPGAQVTVRIVLPHADPPVISIDTVRSGSPASRIGSHAALGAPEALRDRLPLVGQTLGDLLPLAASGEPTSGFEGLGEDASGIWIDGMPFRTARHPVFPVEQGAAVLPLLGIQAADQLWSPLDLEWDGFAGALTHAGTERGTRALDLRAYGDWTGGGIAAASDYFDASQAGSSVRGGLRLSGPIIRDTAHFVLGADAERLVLARPRVWLRSGGDATLLAAAQNAFGVDLGAYVDERPVEGQRVSAFGRFDWSLAARHRVAVWGGFAVTRGDDPVGGPGGAIGIGSSVEGSDLAARGSVTSAVSRVVANELRVAFEQGSRDYLGSTLPETRVASLAAAFGTDAGLPGRFGRTAVTVSDALHLRLGSSRIKLGGTAALETFDQQFAYGESGAYWFSDPAALGLLQGVYRGVAGTAATETFSAMHVGAFFQNTWTLAAGLDVTVGLRYDGTALPGGEILRNSEWLSRTGLANDSIDSYRSRLAPRFGFVWRVGELGQWQVHGDVGTYSDAVDPGVLGEVIGEHGRNTVRYAVGSVGQWTGGEGPGSAADVGARLTLLGPSFELPRSSKASLGFAHLSAGGGVFSIEGRFRHTDFLPRRHDLNRPLGPSGTDQYGRPVYGTLEQSGGLVAPVPESNRRFDGFDLVSALDVDGYSNYWAVTARVQQPMGRFLGLLASFTYSGARDNWLSGWHGGPYAQLTPFPGGLGGQDWAEGVSDFDVPQRVVAGMEVKPLGREGFTIAGVYRYRSGLPFTPGFRDGVDINGDGSGSNDPAYLDDGVAGIGDLLATWDCLRPLVGQFAERNACRDPAVDRLDLRVGIGPIRVGRYPLEAWVEVMNVTDAREAVYDHAVYLVDAAGSLTVDAANRVTSVPLIANPDFGSAIAERSQGRWLRLGLRVNY